MTKLMISIHNLLTDIIQSKYIYFIHPQAQAVIVYEHKEYNVVNGTGNDTQRLKRIEVDGRTSNCKQNKKTNRKKNICKSWDHLSIKNI